MKVSWRTLGTVLLEEEVLDKAFSRPKRRLTVWMTPTVCFVCASK